MMSDITENNLDKIYNDFQNEQQKILLDIKSNKEELNEVYNTKQFNLINNIMINILKLRNLKRKQKQKINNF
jgi:Spy/CpxP family protein refolding chaperone